MKILVTGSHGFLGRHVVAELGNSSGIKLETLDRDKSLSGSFARRKFADTYAVVHLAGVNRDSAINLHSGNTLFTLQLLEAIRQYSPNVKLIYASSSQASDDKSFYGLTKFQSESYIRWYGETHGLRSVILRFPNIYGPFCKPFYNSVIATYIYQMINHQPLTVHGSGQQRRDFLYVSDAVEAIRKALRFRGKNSTELIDISSGKLMSINRLLSLMRKLYPKHLSVNTVKANGKQTDAKLPNGKAAESKLHWRPSVPIETGLKLILETEYGIKEK